MGRPSWGGTGEIGGPDQNRTDDLLIANETLSQLSYGPTRREIPRAPKGGAERGGIWLAGVRPVKQRLRSCSNAENAELPGAAGAVLHRRPRLVRVRPTVRNPGREAACPVDGLGRKPELTRKRLSP